MKRLGLAMAALMVACQAVEPTATARPPAIVPTTAAATSAPSSVPPAVVPSSIPAPPTFAPKPTAVPTALAATATPDLRPRTVAVQVPDQFKKGRLTQPRQITLPGGFSISVFASGMSNPRFMALGQDGTLYVTGLASGVVYAMRAEGGVADEVRTWARGLRKPHGIAVHDGYLYVGEEDKVSRFKIGPNGERASDAQTVVGELPAGRGHYTRTVGFGPDGKLYLAIGSSCNVCEESDPRRAAISVYDPDGKNGKVLARGLRNAVGFVWRPGTPQMWATYNGRDNLGDDVPLDALYAVRNGMDAGWPRCHPPGRPDPQLGNASSCQGVEPPAATFPAHSAPLGLRFYDGKMFPADYRGDLFVAVHGSWNRSKPIGYKLVRVRFNGGDEPGQVEDFLTGFASDDGARAPSGVAQSAWARPVDVLVAPDGALLVTDDDGGAIFRIAYVTA